MDNSSSGFVYFKTDSTAVTTPADTQDYLGFTDSPQTSQNINFSPKNYSSPQKRFYNNSPRNFSYNKRKSNDRQSGNYFNHSKSFNNTYTSFNSSCDDSSLNTNESCNDFSKYFHPSFLEDPWAELEQKLDQKNVNDEEITT